MPAPSNDNFANALLLDSVESGVALGNNIGATAEVFEFLNNGRTVWYKWIAPSTKSFYFNTRWNGAIAGQQTDFPTIVDIFDASLNHIVRGTAQVFLYERRTRVQHNATQGVTYYIRIDSDGSRNADGSIKTGHLMLWWEPIAELSAFDCSQANCPPGSQVGQVNLGCFTFDIFSDNTIAIPGSNTPGRYVFRHCSGTWDYGHPQSPNTSWVIGRVPQLADQTWAGQTKAGFFLDFHYHNTIPQIAVYPEPVPDGNGYATPEAALAVVKCSQLVFNHDGNGLVAMHFSDEKYSDNTAVNKDNNVVEGPPAFEAFRVVPVFVAGTSCGQPDFSDGDADPASLGKYQLGLQVTNLSDFDFLQVHCHVSGPGITQNGPDVTVDLHAHQTQTIGVRVQISPITRLNTVAVLGFSGTGGDTVQYPQLFYDLTPRPDVVSHGVFKIAGPKWDAEFQKSDGCGFPAGGLGPTRNLIATFEESGGVTKVKDRLGTLTNSIPIDKPLPGYGDSGGTFGITFTPDPPGISQVTFTIKLRDPDIGIDFPPVKLTQPCPV